MAVVFFGDYHWQLWIGVYNCVILKILQATTLKKGISFKLLITSGKIMSTAFTQCFWDVVFLPKALKTVGFHYTADFISVSLMPETIVFPFFPFKKDYV